MLSLEEINKQLHLANSIPYHIIAHIHQEKWLQIWVPKEYNGLGVSFANGLKTLKQLACTNGSLGWMITLCAGANYFARNLKPHVAIELFKNESTCFGGSGMIGGSAEKINNTYIINGFWKYATGAPHLSHFTLNATVTQNKQPLLDADGNEIIRSFIIPKADVEIIEDWKAMGMKATGTFSFKVDNILVTEDHSFSYNEFYTNNVLDKIPFRVFADLTLLVNYLGMAEHFLDEAKKISPQLDVSEIEDFIYQCEEKITAFATSIEDILQTEKEIITEKQLEIHTFGEDVVKQLAHQLLEIYFQLGIKASHSKEPINQIFRDFFTATQHANFRS